MNSCWHSEPVMNFNELLFSSFIVEGLMFVSVSVIKQIISSLLFISVNAFLELNS